MYVVHDAFTLHFLGILGIQRVGDPRISPFDLQMYMYMYMYCMFPPLWRFAISYVKCVKYAQKRHSTIGEPQWAHPLPTHPLEIS